MATRVHSVKYTGALAYTCHFPQAENVCCKVKCGQARPSCAAQHGISLCLPKQPSFSCRLSPACGKNYFSGRKELRAVRRQTLKPRPPAKGVAIASIVPTTASVQLAAALFTFGTAFVMPVYTAMIFAPKQPLTRQLAESPIPYIVLGGLYIYLLRLSWTPETLPLMFSSKYWLPELPGITRMFSSTLTVASAWIHLIAVDLFAARHVFLDGLQHKMETRHSLTLCLMFGPIGILSHSLTKIVVPFWRERQSTGELNLSQ